MGCCFALLFCIGESVAGKVVLVSSGPIEFLGEQEPHDSGVSEFGGHAGLIQPEKVGGGEDAHVDLEAFEVAGIQTRAAGVPLDPREQITGESSHGEEVVDPVTGRILEPDASEDVSDDGGTLSDLKPV